MNRKSSKIKNFFSGSLLILILILGAAGHVLAVDAEVPMVELPVVDAPIVEKKPFVLSDVIGSVIDPFMKPQSLVQFEADMKRKADEERRAKEEERERLLQEEKEREARAIEQGTAIEPQATTVVLPEMKLTGIIYGVKRPQAIINGQVYDVGARINFGEDKGVARVSLVERGRVVVSYIGEDFTLTLGEVSKNADQ